MWLCSLLWACLLHANHIDVVSGQSCWGLPALLVLSLCAADSGFKCTYCGAAVAMTQQQRIQQAQQQQQQDQDPGSSSAAPDAAADAQAQAVAFKDRLVDYDKNSQKRTTVIDDQSDFFEIETNAWLSEEVSSSCVAGGVCRRLQGQLVPPATQYAAWTLAARARLFI